MSFNNNFDIKLKNKFKVQFNLIKLIYKMRFYTHLYNLD